MPDKVRGLTLTGDVLTKHKAQVAEMSTDSERSQRIHQDITADIGERFESQFNTELDVNKSKLESGFQITDVELDKALSDIDSSVEKIAIVFEGDAFSPVEEFSSSIEGTNTEIVKGGNLGHSDMKYDQGTTAYAVSRLL